VNRFPVPQENNWPSHQDAMDQKTQEVSTMLYTMFSYDAKIAILIEKLISSNDPISL
jgi:hypothetical protein